MIFYIKINLKKNYIRHQNDFVNKYHKKMYSNVSTKQHTHMCLPTSSYIHMRTKKQNKILILKMRTFFLKVLNLN